MTHEDAWIEIQIEGKYYDCNVFVDEDTGETKIDVYKVKPDPNEPGFRTTDLNCHIGRLSDGVLIWQYKDAQAIVEATGKGAP